MGGGVWARQAAGILQLSGQTRGNGVAFGGVLVGLQGILLGSLDSSLGLIETLLRLMSDRTARDVRPVSALVIASFSFC